MFKVTETTTTKEVVTTVDVVEKTYSLELTAEQVIAIYSILGTLAGYRFDDKNGIRSILDGVWADIRNETNLHSYGGYKLLKESTPSVWGSLDFLGDEEVQRALKELKA